MSEKDNRKNIELELSLSPDSEAAMLPFEKDMIKDDISKFPTIKEGQMSIQNVYVFNNGETIEASLYILNGLEYPINFARVPFIIIDKNGEKVACQSFDLKEVGIIHPNSVIPLKIYFDKKSLLVDTFPVDGCKVYMDTKVIGNKTVKVDFENIPNNTSDGERNKYVAFLEKLPLIKEGTLDIYTYDVNYINNNLYITFVIRNGSTKLAKLHTLPISVLDANESKIVQGIYDVENIEVNPYKANIYNFVFTSEEFSPEGFNMGKFTVLYK